MTREMIQDLLWMPHSLLTCGDLVFECLCRFGRECPLPAAVLAEADQAYRDTGRVEELERVLDSCLERVQVGAEQPGDIVFMHRVGPGGKLLEIEHVAVVIEPGLILHSTKADGVRMDPISKMRKRIHSIARTAEAEPC